MKNPYEVSRRDKIGDWHDIGAIEAASSEMARNIAFNRFPKLGTPGDCETHRVRPGKTVYEYANGALCVALINE